MRRFMQATPVMWQVLLEAGWHGKPPLKMLCGGEAMPRKLAERLLQCGGELWNMYGPTETTVWSSALRVESGDGPVPIGPPIANTQFYILDSHQELAPHGVPGELCYRRRRSRARLFRPAGGNQGEIHPRQVPQASRRDVVPYR